MNLRDIITTKSILNVVILLIGFIASVIGIYGYFFEGRKIQIDYEVLANTNVLDINANITKLDITYAGNSLVSNRQSLRLINLRVRNTGNESILKSYYDNNDPLGIRVSNGKVIENPELIYTSSEYIKRNLHIKVDSTGRISFNDIILEPNESYTLKLLVLHTKTIVPELQSVGKIAGVKAIPVISLLQQANKENSFWRITFGGDIFTQLIRGLSYTIVGLLFVIGITIFSTEIAEDIKRKKRKRVINAYKNHSNNNYKKMDDQIFKTFEKEDVVQLLFIKRLIDNEQKLNEDFNKIKKEVNIGGGDSQVIRSINEYSSFIGSYVTRSKWLVINDMINKSFIVKTSDKLLVNQELRNSLNLFIGYLESIRYNKVDDKIICYNISLISSRK